jgi:hypothetical protein
MRGCAVAVLVCGCLSSLEAPPLGADPAAPPGAPVIASVVDECSPQGGSWAVDVQPVTSHDLCPMLAGYQVQDVRTLFDLLPGVCQGGELLPASRCMVRMLAAWREDEVLAMTAACTLQRQSAASVDGTVVLSINDSTAPIAACAYRLYGQPQLPPLP